MRAFGYEIGDSNQSDLEEVDSAPISLREVTLLGGPAELRTLASFLVHGAELMEKHGANFGHEHLRDWWQDWQHGFVDVIVAQNP